MIDSSEVANAYLLDNGKPLSVAGIVGSGVLRFNSEINTAMGTKVLDRSILTLSSLAGSVRHGQVLTFDGQPYRVDEDPFVSADRVFCRIPVTGPITSAPPTFLVLTTTLGAPLTTTLGALLTTLPVPANA